jgi:hypothetical protein
MNPGSYTVEELISEGDSMAAIDVNGTAVLPAGDALRDTHARVVIRLDVLEMRR